MTVLPPRFLFVEINRACNLRCGHCDYWILKDDPHTLPDSSRLAMLVEEFAAISPHGTIVTCGGEPMLRLESWFELARLSRLNGLQMFSVTNGTRIRSPELARRVIAEGPDEISVSLNSPTESEHDRTRGMAGSFERTTRAIRLLIEARAELGAANKKIIVMGLVYASNYREIPQFYDFVLNDLKADKLKLNLLQPTFRQSGKVDPFFEQQARVDPDALEEIINQAGEKHGLDMNPEFSRQAGMYFRSLARGHDLDKGWLTETHTIDHICNTYERNIMIDLEGVARLCFSTAFRGEKIEKPGDLLKFWNGASDIRDKMRQCNKLCGISHSVRRESATMSGMKRGEEFRLKHASNHG
ncbi:MAG: radical SAM protein [Nitratireductor sp.]